MNVGSHPNHENAYQKLRAFPPLRGSLGRLGGPSPGTPVDQKVTVISGSGIFMGILTENERVDGDGATGARRLAGARPVKHRRGKGIVVKKI